MRRNAALLFVACAISSFTFGCVAPNGDEDDALQESGESSEEARVGAGRATNAALGIPVDDDPSDDILLDKRGFTISYNGVRNVPNWVAWRLVAGDLGQVERQESFRSDAALPSNVLRVSDNDYLSVDYQRGHLCPSADRNATESKNRETFLLTNVAPQISSLNEGAWKELEAYSRGQALLGRTVYQVAGPIFDASTPETIGRGVQIPSAFFKIVVSYPAGATSLEDGPDVRVLSIIIDNKRTRTRHMSADQLTTVRNVQARTGYTFFSALPDATRNAFVDQVSEP